MVLIPLTLLISIPIHKDAIVRMDHEDGDKHVHGNSQRRNPRKKSNNQSDSAQKFSRDGEKSERCRNSHLCGEEVHCGVEAVSSKPSKRFLCAMHKEDDAENEATQGNGVVI